MGADYTKSLIFGNNAQRGEIKDNENSMVELTELAKWLADYNSYKFA